MTKELNDIRQLNNKQFHEFLNSFDTIFTDCDGVLWLSGEPVPGALNTLKCLHNFGKKVVFVSNNNVHSIQNYVVKFHKLGFKATPDQIVIPALAIVWYLKKIKFEGKAYVVGSQPFLDMLIEGGIDVVTGPSGVDYEGIDIARNLTKQQPEIKAVIFDFDGNLNYAKLIRAASHLERKEVLFFVGSQDEKVPISKTHNLIGPGPFQDILINFTGRKPTGFAKPSEILKNYIFERYSIKNPDRCIFIGDSLSVDMKFSEECCFKKLWVNSGVDKTIDLRNNIIPDYYLPNLGAMPAIKSNFNDDDNNK